MTTCEDCLYSDIVDWKQNTKTGKAKPIYWCEKYQHLYIGTQGCENGDDGKDSE